MDDDADNRWPEDTPVKHVSVLKYVQDVSVGMVRRFGVGRIFVSLEHAIESIEDRNQIQDQALDSATPFFMTVALNPLPVIFEVGLTANKSLKELFLFLAELRNLQDER